MQINIETGGRSSMLRRKVDHAREDSEPVEMSLSMSMQAIELNGKWEAKGVLWITSADGKKQVVCLSHDMLLAIRAGVDILEQKEDLRGYDPRVLREF